MTYPSGLVLAYSFDSVGRINQIVATPSGGGAATVLSSATYHPFGGVQGWTFGNSQTYARTYDLDGRVSGFTLAGTAMSLSFDAASRITGQTWFPNSANTVTYGYDNWDRLTSTVTPNTTYGFAYDANSNRTSKTVGVNTWTYAYPGSSNKLSSITKGTTATFTHDANGSITADGTNTFSYGVRGRVTGASTLLGAASYRYNALGQRYLKTLSGMTTAYLYDDAGHLIAETSNGGTSYTEYLWLGDTPVATIKPGSAALYYIHTDHLDTPRLISNQTPATVWRWDNDDPFGANMANANPSGLGTFAFNLRLPGQYFDLESNNHYNYFRDYSPEIGRYIESDPIGLTGGTNTYGYVNGRPLNKVDPSGLVPGAGPGYSPGKGPAPQAAITGGLGAVGNIGPIGIGGDFGAAVGTNGNYCFYYTFCNMYGWNTIGGGSVGIVGSIQTGPLCSGQQKSWGGYYFGGPGIGGEAQVMYGGGSASYGRGIIGPTAGGGAGYIQCTTTYYCASDPPSCSSCGVN